MTSINFTLAHFNPKELGVLDEAQGGRRHKEGTDVPHYDILEDLLSDKNNEKKVLKQYERHAKGGSVGEILRQADQMRRNGRNGDSEVAFIGPNTHRIFNHIMHGGSTNPTTKKPEFFGLSNMMGGIGRTLGGLGKKFSHGINSMGGALGGGMNQLMQGPMKELAGSAMNALPGAIMGGMEGGPMGALAGGGMSMLSNMGGQNGSAPQNLNNLGQQFLQSQNGQQMMNSPMGQHMKNAYNTGMNMYNRANQFSQSPMAQQAMNSPMGQQMMNSRTGQQAQNMYNRGQNAYNQTRDNVRSAYNNADQGYQNAMRGGQAYNNQMMNPSYDDNEGMMNGGGQNMYGQ